MKCPNCMAQFTSDIHNGKALCPFCDSELAIETEDQKTTQIIRLINTLDQIRKLKYGHTELKNSFFV